MHICPFIVHLKNQMTNCYFQEKHVNNLISLELIACQNSPPITLHFKRPKTDKYFLFLVTPNHNKTKQQLWQQQNNSASTIMGIKVPRKKVEETVINKSSNHEGSHPFLCLSIQLLTCDKDLLSCMKWLSLNLSIFKRWKMIL